MRQRLTPDHQMTTAPIPQPFTAYLPPCLDKLYVEGAGFGREDTKGCLKCIAMYYETLAKQARLEHGTYRLLPMLEFINQRSQVKLTEEEIESIEEDVSCSSRSRITCREFKKAETLKQCCVYEDCQLASGYSDADPETKRLANRIMEHGDVLKFLVRQAQRNHVGDEDVLKHLLASVACTNSQTSAGIQPELNGEKGHGKTDAVRAVFHLVPDKWKLAASISAKALYYYKDLPAGAILFSDDVQWSEDLISTVKRSMGNFQEPQTHFTLDKNRNPVPMTMQPRLVWWLSSVESVADDQLKDRQYSLDIDEGRDHAREVSDFLRRSRSKKTIRFSVDRGTMIAREILAAIKEHEPFRVVIDCAEHAEWKVKEDHRTQNKFWDLVEAFAILRFKQRVIDEEGWLHAMVEDFNEAKTIFMRRKANHRTHLTDAQTRVVKAVIALQNEPGGATRARIAEDLGRSFQAVSKSLKAIEANTRFIVHSPGPHGDELYKCTVCALEVVYGEDDIVTLPPDYQDPAFNLIQPPFNPYSTIHSTIENNNSNNNIHTIQPNFVECSNPELVKEKDPGNSQVEPKDCCTLETGLMRLNGSTDNGSMVESEVECEVESIAGDQVEPVEFTILRFLQPVPAIVGLDLQIYGPFNREDVATIPSLNTMGLISKGVALSITPGRASGHA